MHTHALWASALYRTHKVMNTNTENRKNADRGTEHGTETTAFFFINFVNRGVRLLLFWIVNEEQLRRAKAREVKKEIEKNHCGRRVVRLDAAIIDASGAGPANLIEKALCETCFSAANKKKTTSLL